MIDGQLINDKSAPRGLLHLTMKRLAEDWDLFDVEDYPALVDVPLRLRLRLLSYIGLYGPTLDISALQALTQGSETLTYLAVSYTHLTLPTKRIV